ncbi:hypothetical protein V8C37DRAFT_268807 [Trichoderma ceciliae]
MFGCDGDLICWAGGSANQARSPHFSKPANQLARCLGGEIGELDLRKAGKVEGSHGCCCLANLLPERFGMKEVDNAGDATMHVACGLPRAQYESTLKTAVDVSNVPNYTPRPRSACFVWCVRHEGIELASWTQSVPPSQALERRRVWQSLIQPEAFAPYEYRYIKSNVISMSRCPYRQRRVWYKLRAPSSVDAKSSAPSSALLQVFANHKMGLLARLPLACINVPT